MSEKRVIKPLALAVGVALAGTFAISGTVNADSITSPFAITPMSAGYMMGESEGEGSCGGDAKKDKEGEGSCGEGSCGGDKGDKGEGSCGGDHEGEAEDKEGEGSCGEGSCGGDKEDGEEKDDAEGSCGEGSCGGSI